MAQPARRVVQERALATRDSLLAAAVALFAERGYDAVGTREIEAAAGVNRGLIAYHFGTKEALWKAAIESLFEDHANELKEAQAQSSALDSVDRLAHVIRSFVRYSAARPEVNRIMVQEGKHDDWRLQWIVERHVKPYYALTKTLYDEAVAAGVAQPMHHEHFHYILVGAAALIFAMAPECRRLSGRDPNAPAAVEAHADALVRLLLPGATHETRDIHARREDPDRPRRRSRHRRSVGRSAESADGHEGVPRGGRRGVGARKKR